MLWGMVYLAFHVILSMLFSQCYKVAERKKDCRTPSVHLFMYLSAVTLAIPLALLTEGFVTDMRVIGIGLAAGVLMFATMRLFFLAMTQGGLAIGWTFVSLAIVIPVVASIWIWNEVPNRYQIAGLLLVVPCVLLFSDLRLAVSGNRRRWMLLVVAASVTTGLLFVTNKAIARLPAVSGSVSEGTPILTYLSYTFLVGGVALCALGEWRHVSLRSAESRVGLVMGFLNVAGAWTFVKALEIVPGLVLFPVKAVCGVVLTSTLAVLIWKERLSRRQMAGIAVGALSVLLVNIKS